MFALAGLGSMLLAIMFIAFALHFSWWFLIPGFLFLGLEFLFFEIDVEGLK
jgi:hypothetical protein